MRSVRDQVRSVPEVHRRHASPQECLLLSLVTVRHALRAMDRGDLAAAEWLREEAGILAGSALRQGQDLVLLVSPGRVAYSAHPDDALGERPFRCQAGGHRPCACLHVTDGENVRLFRVGARPSGAPVVQEVERGGTPGAVFEPQ